jgi:hypothetical protein
MNFPSFSNFLEFVINREKRFVPNGYLPYAPDRRAMPTSAATVALTESKSLTGSRSSPPVASHRRRR